MTGIKLVSVKFNNRKSQQVCVLSEKNKVS